MPDATGFACPDLTTFTRRDELGLEVGQAGGGACTYMIFCRCPMSRSGGDMVNPCTWAAMTATNPRMPSGASHRGGCNTVVGRE